MLKKTIPLGGIALLTVAAPLSVAAADLSADEILTKSNEAMASLDSYASETHIELTMPLFEEEPETLLIHSQEEVTLDPFAMHQIVTTSFPGGEETIELYWTEDGFYQEDPVDGWVKLPEDFFSGFEDLLGMSMTGDLPAQTAMLGDDLVVEETDNAYVLTYEGDGETLMEAAQGFLESGIAGEDAALFDSFLEDVSFNDLSYELTVDKETFYVTDMSLLLDVELSAEGEAFGFTQSVDVTYSDFNNVGPITVPEDVLENAVPIDFDEFEEDGWDDMVEDELVDEEEPAGEELPDTATSNPTYALGGFALAALGGVLLFTRRKTASE